MAIPDPPKAGSPFSPLWTGGWNPKPRKLTTFYSRNYSAGGLSHFSLHISCLVSRPRASPRPQTPDGDRWLVTNVVFSWYGPLEV